MEWFSSKVIHIESGEVTMSPNDVRPLLAYLRITDKTEVDRLMPDVGNSQRRQRDGTSPPSCCLTSRYSGDALATLRVLSSATDAPLPVFGRYDILTPPRT